MAARVDALVLAYQLEPFAVAEEMLAKRRAVAEMEGKAELRLAGLPFCLKRSRNPDAHPFENADLRAMYDRRASGSWVLEVVLRATFLAKHPLVAAIELGRRVGGGFGRVTAERLRRFDLAGDYVGFAIEAADAERLVTTRAKVDSFVVDAKDVDEALG